MNSLVLFLAALVITFAGLIAWGVWFTRKHKPTWRERRYRNRLRNDVMRAPFEDERSSLVMHKRITGIR